MIKRKSLLLAHPFSIGNPNICQER